MILDFEKLLSDQTSEKIIDPKKIFNALHNKSAKYEYLRNVQGEVLDKWQNRRTEKDLVLKMNTGGGKTVIGLLILQSCLNEEHGPAVYITPDNYLLEQVKKEAAELGIETIEDPRSAKFLTGQAILIINIQTLFNGKSKFGLLGSDSFLDIGSIVIDDAHSCLDKTQDQFCLTFSSDHKCFKPLFELFKDDLKTQSVMGVLEIEQKDYRGLLPVPYWAWADKLDQAARILLQESGEPDFDFKWPLIKECLNLASCIFSANKIEISLRSLPIDVIPSFVKAKRRIYMTATLSDDSILISDFDANQQSITSAITPNTASDIGDRMILLPQELNPSITDEDLKSLVFKLSQEYNTVVITPSRSRADFWTTETQNILMAENLHEGIANLKNKKNGLTVLVNKYDGIDLPNDSCRVLVIDGLPKVRRLIDKIEGIALGHTKNHQARQVQKIEQGMGRGIRSSNDYCAVLLLGSELTKLIHSNEAKAAFSKPTQTQLTLSENVAKQLQLNSVDERTIIGTIKFLLDRNQDWIKASKASLANVTHNNIANINNFVIHQRLAFDYARKKNFSGAVDEIRKAVNHSSDEAEKAWLLQQVAEYTYFINQPESHKILAAASEKHCNILKPLTGVTYKRILLEKNQLALNASSYLSGKYTSKNHLLIGINSIISKLTFTPNTSTEFEIALTDLANHIGFKGQRAEQEYNSGPDVLWALGELRYLLISCKNGATTSSISKHYTEHLSGLLDWFKEKYDATCEATPLIVHPTNIFDQISSPPNNTRVITADTLEHLKNNFKAFASAIGDRLNDTEEISRQLQHFRFTSSDFINTYTKNFQKAKK